MTLWLAGIQAKHVWRWNRARQGEYFDNQTEVVKKQFDIWKQKQSQSTLRKLRVESKVHKYINTL